MIGFSIPPTDTHFKYLLSAGLRDNISLRQVLFINPDETIRQSVNKIFRPELEERRVVQIQPLIATHPEWYAKKTSDLFYRGTQNLLNRRLSEDHIIESFCDLNGTSTSVSSASLVSWV